MRGNPGPGVSPPTTFSPAGNYGNMSSPSVLFVLREILDHGRPQPGQKGVLVAFGAGFSAFAALIEFASV